MTGGKQQPRPEYRVIQVPSRVAEFNRRRCVVADAQRLQEMLNELADDYEIVAAGVGDGEVIILRVRS